MTNAHTGGATGADSVGAGRGAGLVAGQRIVVVGGAGGVGRAVVEVLSRNGAAVAIVDVDETAARAAAGAAAAHGVVTSVIACDIRQAGAMTQVAESARADLGGIDGIVAIAGGSAAIAPFQPTHLYTDLQWAGILDLNLGYVFRALRSMLPVLVEQGTGGSIVAISSISGVVSSPMHSAYGVAKAGLVNLARSVATEYGATGIRMNVVAPGPIDVPRLRTLIDSDAAAAMDAATPLGRRALAEDIADTVLFFCSPLSRYVTGQCLVVDGGASSRFPVPLPGVVQTLPV